MFSSHIDLIDSDQKYLYNSLNNFSPINSEIEKEFINLNSQFNIINEPTEDNFNNDSLIIIMLLYLIKKKKIQMKRI